MLLPSLFIANDRLLQRPRERYDPFHRYCFFKKKKKTVVGGKGCFLLSTNEKESKRKKHVEQCLLVLPLVFLILVN
jgi:hypothetical protein